MVKQAEVVTDPELLGECRQLQKSMEAPPYNAQFVNPGMFAGATVFRVTLTQPLSPAITAFNLVSFPRMNSANAVVRRNHFHDSAGSGGRLLLQTPGLHMADNVFERFGGLFIWAGEQIYMGGALGLHNVSLSNTTIADGAIQICAGLRDVVCRDTTFVTEGHSTHQGKGCSVADPPPLLAQADGLALAWVGKNKHTVLKKRVLKTIVGNHANNKVVGRIMPFSASNA